MLTKLSFYFLRMIKIVLLLLFIPGVTFVNAQNNTTISGTIENTKAATIQLSINSLYLDKKYETFNSSIKDGHFHFSINLTHGELVELSAPDFDKFLYVEPGD